MNMGNRLNDTLRIRSRLVSVEFLYALTGSYWPWGNKIHRSYFNLSPNCLGRK